MTRSTAAASARFRQRKLSTRQTLQIVKEDQVESADDEAQRNVSKVETGVEKGEEIEHHLQAAIFASQAAATGGKVAQIYIPTPDTIQSSIQYDRLYPLTFSQPATYIRFSSTVEDCSGCPYSLTDEDGAYLQSMNAKRSASTQCTEDQFEEVMNFFEETAQAKQPFAAVDNPPVVTCEEMESAFDENFDDAARTFAKDIYEHWKSRRLEAGNRSLMPGLKFETGVDTDDGDPYVCFRRREVRQVRKTRGRDAQSVEKLRKLRRELEEARQLVAMVRSREITRREQLALERQLFEQRSSLRQVKRNLPDQYKEGDEDILINQKPQKKKPLEVATSQRTPPAQLQLPRRPDGRPVEADLVLLQDVLAEKENETEREINQKIAQHQKWNEGYVDMTRAPLTPPLEESIASSFRTAVAEYLPTPPARGRDDSIAVRYASPSYDGPCKSQPSFRRRIGRGGRLMIDRRGMRLQSKEGLDEIAVDRFKYDQDEDDEEPTYLIDPYDISSMHYRATVSANTRDQAQMQAAKRAQLEGSVASSQAPATGPSVTVLPRNPGPD
ncbi:MAG: histone acetyltransferase complex component Epl1 [Lasallia pustulata]|uniref:Enhancer of polycomb-like protein n=1 Tax=Lasallia pustulata TaxID=136370 RepID=A0A5M8PR90_9LECA|nr:MAG: histone acetyltransferase complex component Epl1 [Lasallia pustulata]